jgi:16S rRNA (adenine1518-N6/adenine1519-N6)-dimethyltransferase
MNAPAHRPRKRFGQNFLHDPAVINRIVRTIDPHPGERLVEIGPGLGALTRPLLKAAGRLDAVEIDRDLIPKLQEICTGCGELYIHNLDVLRCDFASLSEGRMLRVAGNLPYNISTPLIFHLIKNLTVIHDMHFMVQKEVAERLVAAPATEHYGRLGIMVQLHCAVELLFNVGPGAFKPAPKVHSAVVRLTPHRELPVRVDDRRRFAELVNRAFTQRRKTLRNALKGLLSADQIAALDIDPGRRPETLNLADYAALSNAATKAEGRRSGG